MIFRQTYLENARTLVDAGESTTDLSIKDPCTVLWVRFQATNGANPNFYYPLHRCIQAIEIIDGAKVLYSLDGAQAWALACAQLGQAPLQRFSALGGDAQTCEIPIMFGRYWGDREFAFDPTKFVNPQLRVRWNLAVTRAVGIAGFLTGSMRLTVIPELMEGAPTPRALLMAKQHYSWTTAVGTEYIDMPRDYPYQAMMFRAALVAHHPYESISRLKLSCDASKVVPLDLATEDLIHLMMLREPKLTYRISDSLMNGDTFYSYLEELEDVSLNPEGNDDTVLGYFNYEYGSRLVSVFTAGVARVAVVNVGAHVHGYCPFGYIHVPFGDPAIPNDWLQAPMFGSVRLEMTGAHAGAAANLVLVQELPY